MTPWRSLAIAVLAWALMAAVRAAPTLEDRELHLAQQLRCVVCQNQTVAESNAPLAADMRREVRAQLRAGHSDAEIIDFFEQRYGAFVHYAPPVRPSTWLLWGAPFAGALMGLALLGGYLRRRRKAEPPRPLSEADQARVRGLLDEESPP